MNRDATGFIGSIPELYDRGLGPMIFADYATDLAQRVASRRPARVLETAAGTGIVTRRLRDLLPAAVHLTATDLSPEMLEFARIKFAAGEQVEFRPADAMALPFADGSFDVVACQFGVMFFPDKDKSYREVYRVLAPEGRYLFSVWDAHRYNPFARLAHQVVGSFFPSDPPQFSQARTVGASMDSRGWSDERVEAAAAIVSASAASELFSSSKTARASTSSLPSRSPIASSLT